MATKNPRIAFVPSDHVLALVSQLSRVSGQSKATIVSELMDDIAPVVQGQLDAFAAIAAKPEKARQHIESLAAQSIAAIGQATMQFKQKRKPRARRAG